MATTQYIGARYVPMFYTASDNSNSWEAGVQYEALTIVTYLNQSYTSKIPVPASVGNPADNPTYWILTGAYSAQVNQLAQDVDDLDNHVAELEAIQLNPQRDIIVLCDSYGTYNGDPNYPLTYNVYDRLSDYLDWPDANIYYDALNGASWCAGDYLGLLNGLTVTDPDLIRDIYVCGGWNDEAGRAGVSEGAFITALQTFRTAALTAYPNARLHILFYAWGYRSSNPMTNLRVTQGWYDNADKYGWCVHTNFDYVMHNTGLFPSNSVHPNQDGVDQIAKRLADIILTDNCNIRYETLQTESNMDGTPYDIAFPSNMTMRVTSRLHNDLVEWSWFGNKGTLARYGTPISWICDGNHDYDLFDLAGPHILKGYSSNAYAGVTIIVRDSSNNTYPISGKWIIVDNVVKFYPNYIPTPGSGSLTPLTITAESVVIPSINMVMRAI